MNEIISFFSQPFVALCITQIVGVVILLFGLDDDEEIACRSSTYFNFNSCVLKHLVHNNYDQKTGLLIVTLPTILQAANNLPFWLSYLFLFLGLILRFSPIRTYITLRRIKKIKDFLNENETAS